MFSKDRFIEDCRTAVAEGEGAIREIVAEAVSNGTRVMAELGEPAHAGISALYRAHDLTILQFSWAPYMALMPHNHQMFAVIGIYAGREDNIFWRRKERTIEAASAEEALHLLRGHTGEVTFAFVNARLPCLMSGIELARRLAERWPTITLLLTCSDPGALRSELPPHASVIQNPWLVLDVLREAERALVEKDARRIDRTHADGLDS